MQIVFIRHGQPEREWNTDKVADPGLSELGKWQSERLADWLEHEPIDHIISSTKRRAVETVEPLAARLGMEIELEEDFTEIDRNSKVYLPTELLATEGGEYFEAIRAQEYAAIGWDTPEEFHKRVMAAFERLCEAQSGQHIVVACHGGVINRVVSEVVAASERIYMQVAYSGICRVWVEGDRRVLMSMNETGHCCATRTEVTGFMRDGLISGPQY
ncbi:histidine phosphatase family protein [Candidatus Poriferisocius sp.]|uniref:histidine phosphatase family protein n=1 Tax=Candidatus Poriferisocius sp. TaxID=3101276 RepID=UPI003B02C46B